MRKLYVMSVLLLCVWFSAFAQPTVLYSSINSTPRIALTDLGTFRQGRLQANQTGNQFWAFHIGTTGAPDYSQVWRPYTGGNVISFGNYIPTSFANGAKYNTAGGGSDGEINAAQNSFYYTFNTMERGSADAEMQVLETSYNPANITTATQSPVAGGVAANNEVTLTITTSSAPAVGENIFVRYTTDAYATSTLLQVSFSGSIGTVVLPCQAFTTNVSYYIFSSSESLAGINSDVSTYGASGYDLATLNLNNNGGSNYSYTVVAPLAPSVNIAAAPATPICVGTSVTFTATPTNGGALPTYQWQINGIDVGGQTAANFTTTTLNNNDVVTVVMTSNTTVCLAGTAITSNTITETVNPNLPASVTIAAAPVGAICAGTSVTFTPTPTNGGAAPTYQWKVNGTNVATGATYTTTTLINTDVVTVEMTSNATPCLTGSPATSAGITMTVNPNLPASVTIAAVPAGAICAGTSVTFTPTPTNGGATPTYQWKVNGTNVATGATYTTTTLINTDVVTVQMTSNATPCLTGSPATSAGITITVNPIHTISLTSGSSTPTLCINTLLGTNIVYTIGGGATSAGVTGLPAGMVGTLSGTTYTISGTPTASGSFLYTVTTTGNGCTVATATGTITVSPIHTISLTSGSSTPTLCINTLLGTNIVYTIGGGATSAGVTGLPAGMIGTLSGGTTYTISGTPTASGTFNYTVTTTGNSCIVATATGTITVQAAIVPSVTIAASPAGVILAGTSVTFTPTPTNGGASPTYQWQVNGTNVAVGATYTTTTLVNGDIVRALLTSNATPCLSPTTVPSAGITTVIGVVRITATTGNVGPTIYTTVKNAFDAINLGTHTGAITVDILGNTTETVAAVLNASGTGSSSYSAISLQPVGGGARTVTGSIATALIDLNGADNVNIDGLNTGGNSLTFSNTNTGATATIRLYADATFNTIKNCTILSAETSTTGGAIVFGAGTNGNDNNLITLNNIGPVAVGGGTTATYTNGIYSSGVAINFTKLNTISNNNVYDFFTPASTDAGINIAANNHRWKISANSFYQTVSRTASGTSNHNGIIIAATNGDGFILSNNFIGGNAPSGVGTWTVGGGAYRFVGMQLGFTTVTVFATSSVQNNTISKFNITTTSSGGTFGVWCGIGINSGNINIGTLTGNTIGASSGTGSVIVTSSSGPATSYGINHVVGVAANCTISNNIIGSLTFAISGNNTHGFIGINVPTTVNSAYTINNNIIGNTTTANSINCTGLGGATNGQPVIGIFSSQSNSTINVTNNTIANLTNAATNIGATTTINTTKGILVGSAIVSAAAVGSTYTITGNTISNLSNAGAYTGANSNAALSGISFITSTSGNIISGNTITNLSNSSTGATFATGIYLNVVTATVSKNNIYNIVPAVGGATPDVKGISVLGGTVTASNNMIRLGYKVDGSAITASTNITGLSVSGGTLNNYFNSVLIGGTGVTTGGTTAAFNNQSGNAAASVSNIFANIRSGGAANSHLCVIANSAGALASPDYNAYFGNGTGFALGRLNVTNYATLCTWRTATTKDANSIFANPSFIDSAGVIPNLHLNLISPLESKGITAGGITDDIDGNIRTATPDIGADEGAFTTTSFAVTATATSPSPICAGTNLVLTAAGTGPGGLIYGWTGPNSFTSAVQSPTITAATIAASGTYILTVTDVLSGCITATSNVTVTVNALLPASVTISASPAGAICAGTSVIFMATPSNGGGAPTYQWKVNGSNVATGATYITSTLVNTDVVTVVMTSNATPCLTGSPATSAGITMVVNPILPASVTIAAAPLGAVCAGTSVTFTPTATNGGASPTYQWKVNGINVATGATYTTSSLTNGQIVTVVMTSNATPCLTGSPATSAGITMVVNAPPSASIAANTTICSGSSATLLVTLTGTPTWDFDFNAIPSVGPPPPPGSITGVLSSPYSLVVSPTVTTTYSIVNVSSGGCFVSGGVGGSVTVTVIPAGGFSWSGAISTDWTVAGNWVCGNVPIAATNDVSIPAGAPRYPLVISGQSVLCKNITIAAGAKVEVTGSGLFNLYGTITGNNNFDLSDGTLNVLSATTLSGATLKNKAIKNLVASSSFGISAVANDTLKVLGTVSFAGGSTTITTGDNLTLVSNATGTARVADITNAGANSGNVVSGKVNIERYLQNVRAWRFLSTPITGGQSIKDAYMEGGTPLISTGYGFQLSGPASIVGVDFTSPGTSMKYYDALNDAFISIADVNSPIVKPAGYFVFVRGDRGTTSPATSATTLRMKGGIISGDVSFDNNINTAGFMSVGNPYPSQVDFRTVTKTGNFTGSVESYTAWNPNPPGGGVYGVGKYDQFINVSPGAGGNFTLGGGGGITRNLIESGQAIFMQASTPTFSTITFKETDKSNGAVVLYNRGGLYGRAGVQDPTLEISLYAKEANGTIYKADATIQKFADNNSNIVDKNDVGKITNSADNLFIVTGGKKLIFERRKTLVETDTIFLNLTNTRVAPYKFVIDPSVLGNTGLKAILKDKFLQSETEVSMVDSTTVNFDITANAASKVADRFMIVFKAIANPQFTTIAAVRNADKTVKVNWAVQNELSINNYTIEQSNDGINFAPIATKTATANNGSTQAYSIIDATATKANNWYRVKATIANSAAKYTAIAMVGALPADPIITPMISVYPNPVTDGKLVIKFANNKGFYTATLLNAVGQTMLTNAIKITTEQEMKTIVLADNMLAGKYTLVIVDADGNKKSIAVLVK